MISETWYETKGKVERPFRYIREDLFLGRGFRNRIAQVSLPAAAT